jgi:hypothetical protein
LQFEDHHNYNCEILTDDGQKHLIYANWLRNQDLHHWQGWICHAGNTRLYIDKNFEVWGGECKNNHLGSALSEFNLIPHAICHREKCTGCTDDLIVAKRAPSE